MKRLLLILTVVGLLAACSERKYHTRPRGGAVELLREVSATRQVDHTLHIIDSLELEGEMQPPVSDYWRGMVYDIGRRYWLADYYYQQAFDAYTEPISDWNDYALTGYRLASMKLNMQNYDEGLRIATRLVAQADSLKLAGHEVIDQTLHAFLLSLIADFQTYLQQNEEASRSCLRAYEVLTDGNESDAVDRYVICTNTVGKAYR